MHGSFGANCSSTFSMWSYQIILKYLTEKRYFYNLMLSNLSNTELVLGILW